MDQTSRFRFLWLLTMVFLSGNVKAHWKSIRMVNRCPMTIWPGIAANKGHLVPGKGGFALAPGHTEKVVVPWTWQGRVWGRTGCGFDGAGNGSCVTGDCGGKLECNGEIGKTPATLAQFTFQPQGTPSYYDVSLVDGYNMAISVKGGGVADGCATAGCGTDVNQRCPAELQVVNGGKVVACKSACVAFNLDRFCCRNEYGSPNTCPPNIYSRVFKDACPAAYSYAYDSPSPLFTCNASDFMVTFCPPAQSDVERSVRLCGGSRLRFGGA